MVFEKQPSQQKVRFWTNARVAFTFVTLAVLVAVVSNCRSTSEVNLNANETKTAEGAKTNGAVTVKNGPPPPVALISLPESVKATEIKTIDSKSLRLSDYSGKVVVLDLWATWCGPCRGEIPHLVDLSQEYAGKGVEVIGLTIEDPQRDAQAVRDFANEFKINYKIGWAERSFALALMNGNGSIPQTFVITRDGRILKHFIGFSPGRTNLSLREAVNQAVSGA